MVGPRGEPRRVLVVGGSLPGIAAAARLARVGHAVTLLERENRLGGRWAEASAWPATLELPAAWRDLFRKSGRPLETELTRAGLALEAAPATVHALPGRPAVEVPTDRGAQALVVGRSFGAEVADRWRETVDDLTPTWQVLRRLGLEADEAPTRADWKVLRPRRSLATTAKQLGAAGPLAEAVGWPDDPRRVPGWRAVALEVARSFGQWRLTRDGDPVGLNALVELLTKRLDERGVDVRLDVSVTAITAGSASTAEGPIEADAVLDATNPWSGLSPAPKRLRPAASPRIDVAEADAELAPRVDHAAKLAAHMIRTPDGWVTIRHDFAAATPDPGAGAAWQGAASWRRRPPIVGDDGVFRASAASRGGAEPWAQILSGALATYAIHDRLAGVSIRPVDDPRKLRRARG